MYKHSLQWASIGLKERYGLIGLMLALAVVIGLRLKMHIATTYKTPSSYVAAIKTPKETRNPSGIIHINTADSGMLCALRGVGGKSAHRLLEARRKKRFTHAYEVLEYLHIKERDWKELRKRIRFQ